MPLNIEHAVGHLDAAVEHVKDDIREIKEDIKEMKNHVTDLIVIQRAQTLSKKTLVGLAGAISTGIGGIFAAVSWYLK